MNSFIKRIERMKSSLEDQENPRVVIICTDGREETTTMLEAILVACDGDVVDFHGDGIGESPASLLRAMIDGGKIDLGDISEVDDILKADTVIIDDIV